MNKLILSAVLMACLIEVATVGYWLTAPIPVAFAIGPVESGTAPTCDSIMKVFDSGTDAFSLQYVQSHYPNNQPTSWKLHNFTASGSLTYSVLDNRSRTVYNFTNGVGTPVRFQKHGIWNESLFGDIENLNLKQLNASVSKAVFTFSVNGTKDSWVNLKGFWFTIGQYNKTALKITFSAKHLDFYYGPLLANITNNQYTQYKNFGISVDNLKVNILVDCSTGKYQINVYTTTTAISIATAAISRLRA